MRLVYLGAAAVALSGCSWFGGSSNYSSHQSSSNGYYTQGGECCKPLSKWNIEGAVGPEFIVGGDAFTGGDIHPAPGVTASTQSMKDVFDPGVRMELGGSYALNPNRKVTLMGSYAKASGEEVNMGTYGGSSLTGEISDYKRIGVEAGVRQYFRPHRVPVVKGLRPYVEGKLGVSKVDDITLNNAMYGGAVENGGTVGVYEGGWVPTAAGMVGVEAPIFKRATLGLETGLRYTGGLKSDNTYFDGAHALSGVNNGSSSLSMPVMLRGRYRF